MAKTALIQRELKRDKLVAQYAKKYEELKSIANDAKKSDEERMAARLQLQKLPRNACAGGIPTSRAEASAA